MAGNHEKLHLEYMSLTMEQLNSLLNFPSDAIKVASIYVDLSCHKPMLKIGFYDPQGVMSAGVFATFRDGKWLTEAEEKQLYDNIEGSFQSDAEESLAEESLAEESLAEEAVRERKAL